MLDASEREHVGLRIGPDLLGHGLETCDHVVQGDPLLDTVLVAGQEPSGQLGLLARRVPPSDRTRHRRRVEDPVSEGRHGFRRRTYERRSGARLEQEYVTTPVDVPEAGDDVGSIILSVDIDVESPSEDGLRHNAVVNRAERLPNRPVPTGSVRGRGAPIRRAGRRRRKVGERRELGPKRLGPMPQASEDTVVRPLSNQLSGPEPRVAGAIALELEHGHVEEPGREFGPHPVGDVIGPE